jgi:hypothetical protein
VGVVIQFVAILVIPGGILYLIVRRNRERDGNAPQRNEIDAQASFRVSLRRASVLGTGGLGGTRGIWIPLRGPKRLTVGTDGFVVSAPQALREFAFTGRYSSIAVSRVPSQLVSRDWIVITPRDGGRRLAIMSDNLPEIWQALAGTGATPDELEPAGTGATPDEREPAGIGATPDELEPAGNVASGLARITGWRRAALGLGCVVVLAFLPALVDLIAHHLP